MVSAVVLTFNEEKDITRCLNSLSWCDDVHVLDSGSTDNTCAIAASLGAKTTTNPFSSFGQQRNFALDALDLRHPWILFLDADEVVTPAFRTAMEKAMAEATEPVAGFYCCWKMMLEERWLKRSDNYPKWQFRLLKKGRARFGDFGHGQKEADVQGTIEYLKEPYLHYGFSKGWTHWLARHNKYSTLEAVSRLESTPPFKNIFNRNSSIRNPALKSWLIRVPGWPFFRFFYSYILRLGFFEGAQGFIYCVNMGYYEFLIKIKIRELKMERKEQLLK
jgi:glycosyltransferase involved in cell wall biosynthesis